MMRARNRHSASNYLFAAFLELVIMGLFVVIAQPQLRESLFELLEPRPSTIGALVPTVPTAAETTAAKAANYGGLSDAAASALPATGQHADWSITTASYAPLEQFEAFTVSSNGAEKRVAGYAPAVGATQLNAIDWNIASTGRPLRPVSNWPAAGWPSGGWTASRPAEAAYRDTYPPPYGTQSQWK